jgi:hypothetical protein
MKHEGFTPGPWRVGKSKAGKIPLATQPPAVMDSDGNYLAVLGGGSIHFRNAEANAALIANAPALLAENERLRAALESLLCAVDSPSGAEIREWMDGNVLEARAALAPDV